MSGCNRHNCVSSIVVLILTASQMIHAQTVEFLYEPPKDYVEWWAKIVTLCLTLVSMALISTTLLFMREKLSKFLSKSLLFLGICILPFPVMIMSTAVGLEQAKAIGFCDSCHVMSPFVKDMNDPESDRLAAIHFKNRYIQQDHCYTCHTDYGLFGTIEAKIGGLDHIWKETTGNYNLPVQSKANYRFTICLNCHGQSQKFLKTADHKSVIELVITGETACTECHDLSHPEREERDSL